jgi:hypothetical protein
LVGIEERGRIRYLVLILYLCENEIGLYDNGVVPQGVRIQRYHGYTDNLSLTNIYDGVSAAENQSFWLSAAGRLQNADGPWGQDLYYHDGVGNRTQFSRTVTGATTTRIFTYGGSNNLNYGVTIGAANDRVFTYDASGNQTADNRGAAGSFTHVVNGAGRIGSTSKGGVLQGAYTYDAFERLRVRTLSNQTPTTNNGTTHYVWDIFGRIIAEANGSTGATLRETIYMPTGAGDAMPIAAVNAAVSPKLTYAVYVDHLNRPIMLTGWTAPIKSPKQLVVRPRAVLARGRAA